MKTRKSTMRKTRLVPVGMVPLVNGEAAPCGTAMLASNVREQELALQVTGQPVVAGTIGVGERLLLVHGDHRVTSLDGTLRVDGVAVATVGALIVGAHAIGGLIVVVTRGGLVYLSQRDGGAWTVLDWTAACPRLSLTAACQTSSAEVAGITFDTPYSQWQAPLASTYVASLTALMRASWDSLTGAAVAQGRHCGPMLVRWAVRLHDDSYLWMSAPVRVGDETLANADRITANVTTSSNGFTGTQATVMQMIHYGLTIGVEQGIAADWLPLVKSIDVLATREASLLASGRVLDYRCYRRTTGPREYVLEMGLARRSAAEVASQLASSPWTLIATAPAAATMTGADFVAPIEALTLTNAQCASTATMATLTDVTCSADAAGRLYCCTAGGDIVVSVPGNALVEAHRRAVLGTVPLALAVVTRALYAGGFGRYAVYVFTDDGIYAVPHGATGQLGEARLVDRTVIAGVSPVEAGSDVWLVSRHGHLCRLSGSRLEVCQRDVDYRSLAWCNAWQELWMLPSSGDPVVRMASGRMSRRTVAISQLYSDPRHALAVSPSGQVLDLEREQEAVLAVSWHSHPVPLDELLGASLKRVVWHLSAAGAALTLKVMGQRGIMTGDSVMSETVVNGDVDQPLAAPAIAARARTVRLEVDGAMASGSLLLPTLLYTADSGYCGVNSYNRFNKDKP